jgi:hypothetical protein
MAIGRILTYGILVAASSAGIALWRHAAGSEKGVSVARTEHRIDSGGLAEATEIEAEYPPVQPSAVPHKEPSKEPAARVARPKLESSKTPAAGVDPAAQFAAEVQGAFDTDSAPGAASRRMESDIKEVLFAWDKKGVALDKLECRLNLCRMQMTFSNQEKDRAFFESVFVPGGSQSESLRRYGANFVTDRDQLADGRVKVTFYMAREGSLVPVEAIVE